MKKGLIIGTALLMLAAGSAFEFSKSGRSASELTIKEARSKLNSLPLKIGDWVGVNEEFDSRQLEVAEAAAYLCRDYENTKTKEHVKILILTGKPQAIGAHDPTVCYGGAGFKQKNREQKSSVTSTDGKPHAFWSSRFDTDTFPPISLQVLWAWTVDGNWQASSNPRLDFASEPLLYKIYLSRQIGSKGAEERDASQELLRDLLPELRNGLSPLPNLP